MFISFVGEVYGWDKYKYPGVRMEFGWEETDDWATGSLFTHRRHRRSSWADLKALESQVQARIASLLSVRINDKQKTKCVECCLACLLNST